MNTNTDINAQLFYKDNMNIIYSMSQNNTDRYFLNIPVAQYTNFMIFIKLKKEDNTKKGTSEYSNEKTKRKEFLQELTKANEFIKNLNSNMVYSRVNRLTELPIKELEEILDENKIFDMNKYKEISKKIEDIINNNFRLMTSPNIKKESIEETIAIINQKEQDKKFIEWLKVNLPSNNTKKNIEELRMEYKKETISINIEDFKEIKTNEKKFIMGKNTRGETYTVEIPNQYSMLQIFELELKTVDKTKLINIDNKFVAKILFDKIILDLPSQKMVKKHEQELVEENKREQNLLNNETKIEDNNYLYDQNNNIAYNEINNNVIAVTTNPNGEIIAENAEVATNNFDPNTQQPQQAETIQQSKGKRKILVPAKNPIENHGFIKFSTLLLFTASLVLTIASLVLLIAS